MKLLTDEGYLEPSNKISGVKTSEYFEVILGNFLGSIKATGDHLWSIIDKDGNRSIETTDYIYNNFDFISSKNGILLDIDSDLKYHLKRIKKINDKELKEFSCFNVDTDKHQFYIYPKRNFIQDFLSNIIYKKDIKRLGVEKAGIFVHNCQSRIGCGRLPGMASMMLFGSTVGTSINGAQQGAGMISANGVLYNIQYFYEEVKWIKNWYKKCGFNEKGYCIHGSYPEVIEERDENEDIELDKKDLDDIFDFQPDKAIFEYDSELRKEINRTEKQSFE